MKKRCYVEPKSSFVRMRGAAAVADRCWSYAKSGKEFCYNTSGPGYAKITLTTTGGCNGATIADVEYCKGATEDKRAEIEAAFASAGGNSAENFLGSPFSREPDPGWS